MPVAAETKVWTLEELHSLPDDGNKYELIRGELFVTPAPGVDHENYGAEIARALDPFVAKHNLGLVYRPRSVVQFEGSEVEPDLMVRAKMTSKRWKDAPVPILVVEIYSPFTQRRDNVQKREFYSDVSVDEYWMVDGERRRVVVRETRTARPDRHGSPYLVSERRERVAGDRALRDLRLVPRRKRTCHSEGAQPKETSRSKT